MCTDTLNRLTEARYDTGAMLTYAYDDAGNRLTTGVTAQDTPDIAVFLDSTELLDVVGSYDFGRVTPQTSTAITLTITNSGAAALRLTGTLAGNARQGFTVTQSGTSVIAPGASTTCQVTFAPFQGGLHAVSLVIANNDVNEQAYTITLTGNGGDIGYLLWSK